MKGTAPQNGCRMEGVEGYRVIESALGYIAQSTFRNALFVSALRFYAFSSCPAGLPCHSRLDRESGSSFILNPIFGRGVLLFSSRFMDNSAIAW